jgi:hypothetical protein
MSIWGRSQESLDSLLTGALLLTTKDEVWSVRSEYAPPLSLAVGTDAAIDNKIKNKYGPFGAT